MSSKLTLLLLVAFSVISVGTRAIAEETQHEEKSQVRTWGPESQPESQPGGWPEDQLRWPSSEEGKGSQPK